MQNRTSTDAGSFFTILISFPVYLAGFSTLIRISSESAKKRLFFKAIMISAPVLNVRHFFIITFLKILYKNKLLFFACYAKIMSRIML